MVNYQNDRELEEDYEIGWEWLEWDTGPLITPYTGFWQCLLDPFKTKPENFFNTLFDNNMYMTMAEETNKYVHRKEETRKYKKVFYFYFISTSNMITWLHNYYLCGILDKIDNFFPH